MAKTKIKVLLRSVFPINEDGFVDLGFGDLIAKEVFIEGMEKLGHFDGVMLPHDHPSLVMNEERIKFAQETNEEVLMILEIGDREVSLIGTISRLDQAIPGIVTKGHRTIVFTQVPSAKG